MRGTIVFFDSLNKDLMDSINYASIGDCERIIDNLSFIRFNDEFYKLLNIRSMLDFDNGKKYFILLLQCIPEEEFEDNEIGNILNYATDLMVDTGLDSIINDKIALNEGVIVDQIFK